MMGRAPLIGSGMVHLAILIVLLVVKGPAPLIVPGPDVVQVALVDPTAATRMVAPRPPPAPPRVEPAEIRPEPGEGVKLQPVKPRVAPHRAPEPEALPAPPTLAYAPVGRTGLQGEVSVDARDFAFTYYLMLVRDRVAANWSPPAGLSSPRPVQALVFFRIARDGTLSGVRLETGSSMEFFDRSALRAVMLSDPLPPLPLGFGGGSLGVRFGFQYAAP